MKKETIDAKGIWRPGIFEDYSNIVACGGSTLLFKMNLGLDPKKPELKALSFRCVSKNPIDILNEEKRAWRFLVSLLGEIIPGVDSHNVIKPGVIHSNDIAVLDEKFISHLHLSWFPCALINIHGMDGLITNISGVPLLIGGADCTPILMFDPVNKAIGVFHS